MSSALSPPALDFFDRKRPAAGSETVRLVLGPLALNISGLDAAMADRLVEQYAPFSTRGPSPEALEIRVGLEDRDYFIDPPPTPQDNVVLLRYEAEPRRVAYMSFCVAGWFDVAGGTGDALVARGDYEPFHRALENYVRSAVAWQAASRGGALVHAASAVMNGKGYLFYGESGAGKSTLSESNRRARIVSDDLSLLLPGENGRLHLVGSPFRGTYTEGDPVQGAFPLAAGFRIVKDTEASVQPVLRIRALSEFVGNMPFVAEAFSRRPDLFEKIEQALTEIPMAHLHFRKDDSYWDAIASWESERG